MCTVTIHRWEGNLLVTMNRDEARSRGPEIPPEAHQLPNGVAWAAPKDSDRGGTWIAMNQHGLAACILNRYQDAEVYYPENAISRGTVIPTLMESPSAADAWSRLADSSALALDRLPAFTLLLADPETALRMDWRGDAAAETCPLDTPWAMVTSSSLDPQAVFAWREAAFQVWLDEGAPFNRGIPSYHLLQPAGMETTAPLMSRDISSTRSISQAHVEPHGRCTLRYAPVHGGAPDWAAFEHPVVLSGPSRPADT